MLGAAITSALATEAVALERKGTVVVKAADVRRVVGVMDDVAGLMGTPGRTARADDAVPDEDATADGAASTMAE